MKKILYQKIMSIGKIAGCHQLPERSFFALGYQFPVCARCTGVFVGNVSAYIIFFTYIIPMQLCLVCCTIIFIDWLIQYIGICESTNSRRLITGVIGGYGLSTLYCITVKYIIQFILNY